MRWRSVKLQVGHACFQASRIKQKEVGLFLGEGMFNNRTHIELGRVGILCSSGEDGLMG